MAMMGGMASFSFRGFAASGQRSSRIGTTYLRNHHGRARVCYGRPMPRKPKPDDPEQFKRFIETARQIGADVADQETFDRVLGEVARSSRPKPTPKTRRPRKPKDRS
jgi:hypothetical protein